MEILLLSMNEKVQKNNRSKTLVEENESQIHNTTNNYRCKMIVLSQQIIQTET